jgi:hypothetical protein
MNCQFSVWRGQGEGFGTFTRLTSRIFFQRFPGGELQLPGVVGFLSDGNSSRTDTPCFAIPFHQQTGIGETQTDRRNPCEIRPQLLQPKEACMTGGANSSTRTASEGWQFTRPGESPTTQRSGVSRLPSRRPGPSSNKPKMQRGKANHEEHGKPA